LLPQQPRLANSFPAFPTTQSFIEFFPFVMCSVSFLLSKSKLYPQFKSVLSLTLRVYRKFWLFSRSFTSSQFVPGQMSIRLW
jgi:hypothetical protein